MSDSWVKEGEEGRCVACSAETDTKLTLMGGGEPIPVCKECHEDGTLRDWLAAELEAHAKSEGWPSHVDENGRTLYTLPEDNKEGE